MKKMIYHGSTNIIENPIYGKGKKNNDYGLGFYCTENKEIAKEWGCTSENNGYVNTYLLDTFGLRNLNLSDSKYHILNWLAILMDNRTVEIRTPLGNRGKQYILDHFLPDYKDYDTIIGYRGDDSYFSFARAFVENTISLSQLSYAMKLGKLGEQYVLISKKAFDSIKFIDYEISNKEEYFPKKKQRDENARKAFRKELEKDDINGIFMRDIIREEIKNDDPRLR